MKVQTEGNKMKCEFCGKEYTTKQSLQGHIQANHWKQLRPWQHGKGSSRKKRKKRKRKS